MSTILNDEKKEKKFYFQPWQELRLVTARSEHICKVCGQTIAIKEKYVEYKERVTDWERIACMKHYNEKKQKEWETRRNKYRKLLEAKKFLEIETDASGAYGERWAFVVRLNGKEIHRDHGLTEGCGCITPAEGYAIVKALEWLKEANISPYLPVLLTNDNSAVLSKLRSGSEHGKFFEIWHKINVLMGPLRKNGRVFIDRSISSEAHWYAQKDQVH